MSYNLDKLCKGWGVNIGTINKYETGFEGLYLLDPIIIDDFYINYDKNLFKSNKLDMDFVQDNESYSKKNVLRGMHIQLEKPQGKLVNVLKGEIYDVVIDLRKNSSTFKKWFGTFLSADNKKILYIPEGFAHGFLVMSDFAKVSFKVSNFWNPNDEIGILWNDPSININWPLNNNKPIIAEKDKNYELFSENKYFK